MTIASTTLATRCWYTCGVRPTCLRTVRWSGAGSVEGSLAEAADLRVQLGAYLVHLVDVARHLGLEAHFAHLPRDSDRISDAHTRRSLIRGTARASASVFKLPFCRSLLGSTCAARARTYTRHAYFAHVLMLMGSRRRAPLTRG